MQRVQKAIVFFVLGALSAATFAAEGDDAFHVYIGTYTGGDSKGIYRATFDASTGELTDATLVAKTENPSFLAIRGKHLYAVNELTKYQGKASGAVSAFQVDTASGKLTEINQQASGGGAPCHLVVDATGKHVLVANYVGGNVASLPIRADGGLGPIASLQQHEGSSVNARQKAPHAHSINLDANNRFAFAADLGLDKVLIYGFDAQTGKLSPHEPAAKIAPGSGPRHFVFHPSGKFAYVINELQLTVTAFAYNADAGSLKEIQTISTVPDTVKDRKGLSTAEIRVTPDGRFLYGSNRGHDTLAMYSINTATGRLTSLGNQPTGGRTPRNFNVGPTGKFLFAANQSTHNVVVFRIDPKTGALQGTGRSIYVPNPVCVRFAPKTDN